MPSRLPIARILSPDTATSALIHGAPVPSNTKPFSMMTSALSVELSCANTPQVDASSVDISTADSLVMVLSFEVVQNDREATRDILPDYTHIHANSGRYDLNSRPLARERWSSSTAKSNAKNALDNNHWIRPPLAGMVYRG